VRVQALLEVARLLGLLDDIAWALGVRIEDDGASGRLGFERP
jgi:hypothetical protein